MASSRAWTFTTRGFPHSVLSLTSRPTPTLPPSDKLVSKVTGGKGAAGSDKGEWVLIKTAYAALNPSGYLYTTLIPAAARSKTAVPEMDLSGSVEDVWVHSGPSGPAAGGKFRKGERVAAFIPVGFGWPTGTGALAEHVVLPARYVVPVPPGVGLKTAGGLMTAGCTALMTVRAAGVRKGGRVVVNGASGGVGSLAVQMVRSIVGPEGFVVGVCSGANRDLVLGLGADEVVDYTKGGISDALKENFCGEGARFDAVVDCVGVQELYVGCAAFLEEGAVYSAVGIKPATHSYGGLVKAVWTMQMNAIWPTSPALWGTGRKWAATSMMDPGRELMEEVMGMVADGRVKGVVDRELAFEQVPDGYDVVASGRAKGKVMVKVAGESSA
ncbi:Zinc-type alcohol dehydrogenase-like protein [Colletotrichum trifolii]|uniref:Zinc-type alcohol dehydrogenase-like protein n=1 Tax=Colletotrichum trifolii TaxID=5466 RepID=A0A4R8RSB9_COLTR|nr:Zinc-type alcohol dehydrogenase-like protein [Colletotrichum trifolii]